MSCRAATVLSGYFKCSAMNLDNFLYDSKSQPSAFAERLCRHESAEHVLDDGWIDARPRIHNTQMYDLRIQVAPGAHLQRTAVRHCIQSVVKNVENCLLQI